MNGRLGGYLGKLKCQGIAVIPVILVHEARKKTAHIKDGTWDDVIPAKAIQNFGGSTTLREVVMRPTASNLIKETDLDSHFHIW